MLFGLDNLSLSERLTSGYDTMQPYPGSNQF
jgi:hypothetical protein